MDTLSDLTDSCVQQRDATQLIVHPLYNPQLYDNDIALIEVDRPVDYPSVYDLAVNTTEVAPVGTLVTVAGWGATSNGGGASEVANHVQVPIVDQARARFERSVQRRCLRRAVACIFW